MARTANSSKLDTPAARKRLAPRSKPYTMTIAPRRMLGYVRAATGAGRWLSIVEVGRGPTGAALRRQGDLGLADDLGRADGVGILSYSMALGAAAAWQPTDPARSDRNTVRGAIKAHIDAKRAADGENAANDKWGRLRLHVLREDEDGNPLPGPRGLGVREVASLTLTQLRAWRDELVSRTERPVSRSTANRVIADFKAALNHLYADESIGLTSDSAWRRLESFEDTDAQREDHFTEAEALRLIEAAHELDPCFADLLEAAFHTGARAPMELAGLDVRHFNAKRAAIEIQDGKTGRRVTTLTAEGVAFFRRLTHDKKPGDILLPRADGARWRKSQHHRPMKAALKAADLPKSASIYTLRHTYISRSIERGMPLLLIAENVGSSVKMIEKHYAHIIAAARIELIERSAPRLRVVTSTEKRHA